MEEQESKQRLAKKDRKQWFFWLRGHLWEMIQKEVTMGARTEEASRIFPESKLFHYAFASFFVLSSNGIIEMHCC